MVTHTVSIPYEYGQTIKIRPIADVHYGNQHCDVRAFKNFLAEDDEALFVGNGDLLDCIVTSDLKRYRKSADGTDGDDILGQQIDGMYELLQPYKSRILGLGTGNHEDVITSKSGINVTKELCKRLEVPFLGYSSFVRLRLSRNGGGGRTVMLYMHHGYGGGSRTVGGDLTKYAKHLSNFQANVYIYSHVHRLQSDRVPIMSMVGDKLVAKPRLLVMPGTFLKTFSDGVDPTYSERAGYPPVDIGGCEINVKPTASYMDLWVDL